jgi:hypothetical protein
MKGLVGTLTLLALGSHSKLLHALRGRCAESNNLGYRHYGGFGVIKLRGDN